MELGYGKGGEQKAGTRLNEMNCIFIHIVTATVRSLLELQRLDHKPNRMCSFLLSSALSGKTELSETKLSK